MSRKKGQSVGDGRLPVNLRVLREAQTVETANSRVSPSIPAKPDNLPAEASALWDELVVRLDEAGIIAKVDGLTLHLALRHFLAARAASNELLAGDVVIDDGGVPRKAPASQVERDHSLMFLAYAKQLGLSFVARSRMPAADDSSDSNPFRL